MHPHDILGEASFDMLSVRQKKIWKSQAMHMGEYSFIPDRYHNNKSLEKYVRLPNGRIAPHGPTGKDMGFIVLQKEYSEEVTKYIIKYYYKTIVGLLLKNNLKEAVRFAGALAHYIQDSCTPGHIVGNYLLSELMPFPKGCYWNMHRLFDVFKVGKKDLVTGKPALLGTSVTEAVFRTFVEYKKMLLTVKGKIIPCIQDMFHGNIKKRDICMRECARIATHLVASIWHTVFCIAEKKFNEEEREQLKALCLGENIPDLYYTQIPYFSFVPGIMADNKGRTHSLKLYTKRNGKMVKSVIKDGFAVSGSSVVAFEFPRGLYKKLILTFGLHADMSPNDRAGFRIAVEKSRKERIQIEGNLHKIKDPYSGKWISINDWKNKHYVLFDSGPVSIRNGAQKIELSLPQCLRLLLLTYKINGKQTHAVWSDATLMK